MADKFEQTTLLVGLGAPRTGTRWLSNYFAQHPQVLMSPLRVLHYFDAKYGEPPATRFDDQFRKRLEQQSKKDSSKSDSSTISKPIRALMDRMRMISDERAYLDYFHNQWQSEDVLCDITPSYASLRPSAFAAMYNIHSNVKLLFSMRNPIDRLWSGLRRPIGEPGYDPRTELEARVSAGRGEWRHYIDTIENLDQAVPKHAIRYNFFENFFAQSSIDELCVDFLRVSTFPAEVSQPLNQTESIPLDAGLRARTYRKFEPVFQFVYNRFGGDLPECWLSDMTRFS